MTSTGVQLPAWCSIFEFGTVQEIRETALSNAIKRRELQILAAVILADPGSAFADRKPRIIATSSVCKPNACLEQFGE